MKELERKPEVIVFAGPNGSGKSTFTELLRPTDIDYINADEIKKYLKCDDMEAAKMAEKQREYHLANMQEFCFETVLSTDNLSETKISRKAHFTRVTEVVESCQMCWNLHQMQQVCNKDNEICIGHFSVEILGNVLSSGKL